MHPKDFCFVIALLFHCLGHGEECVLYLGQRRRHGGDEKTRCAMGGMCARDLMGRFSRFHGIGPAAAMAVKVDEARNQEQAAAGFPEWFDSRHQAVAPSDPGRRPLPINVDITDRRTRPRHTGPQASRAPDAGSNSMARSRSISMPTWAPWAAMPAGVRITARWPMMFSVTMSSGPVGSTRSTIAVVTG